MIRYASWMVSGIALAATIVFSAGCHESARAQPVPQTRNEAAEEAPAAQPAASEPATVGAPQQATPGPNLDAPATTDPNAAPGPASTTTEPAKTVVFSLRHVDAQGISNLLTELFPNQRILLAVDERTNSITLRASQEQLDVVQAVLKRIDASQVAQVPGVWPQTSATNSDAGLSGPIDSASQRLAAEYADWDKRSRDIADEIRTRAATELADVRVLNDLKTQLREAVEKAFSARQQLQERDVERLRERLKTIESSLTKRESLKAQIIERRTSELLDADRDLRWDPARSSDSSAIGTPQSVGVPAQYRPAGVAPSGLPATSAPPMGSRPTPTNKSTTPSSAPPAQEANSFSPFGTDAAAPQGTAGLSRQAILSARYAQRKAEDQVAHLKRLQAKGYASSGEVSAAEHDIEYNRKLLESLKDEFDAKSEELQLTRRKAAVNLAQAKLEAERVDKLAVSNVITTAERDRIKQALELAQIEMESVELKLKYHLKLADEFAPASMLTEPPAADSNARPSADVTNEALWKAFGLRLTEIEAAGRDPQAVVVGEVEKDNLAQKAGIQVKDVLLGIDKWETKSLAHVAFVLSRPEVVKAESLTIVLQRDGQALKTVLLLPMPARR